MTWVIKRDRSGMSEIGRKLSCQMVIFALMNKFSRCPKFWLEFARWSSSEINFEIENSFGKLIRYKSEKLE